MTYLYGPNDNLASNNQPNHESDRENMTRYWSSCAGIRLPPSAVVVCSLMLIVMAVVVRVVHFLYGPRFR
jgi:hypothetical protein